MTIHRFHQLLYSGVTGIFLIILKMKMYVTFDKIRVTNKHVNPEPLQERKFLVTCSGLIELFTNFCMFMKIQWKN